MQDEEKFTLDELAGLVDLPARTVRYYIQLDLVDRPAGAGRGAHYTQAHLEQLLAIRKWQNAGLSLERIRDVLAGEDTPEPPPRRKGTVEVRSHIVIDEGVELVVDPARADMSPAEVRELTAKVAELVNKINNSEE